jgi:uncharacterized protein
MRSELIVLARWPKLGAVKSRLAVTQGAEFALVAYQSMLCATLKTAQTWKLGANERLLTIYWDGAPVPVNEPAKLLGSTPMTETRFAQLLSELQTIGTRFAAQSVGDIGVRMSASFSASFAATPSTHTSTQGQPRSVVLIGSDCPIISVQYLEQAFDALNANDLVLGPVADGGYSLIGLCEPRPSLFGGIPWSTSSVLSATLSQAALESLRVKQLAILWDIDEYVDWVRWQATS